MTVVRVDAAALELTVDDEGPGFPETLLPRLFEPFVRGGDPARERPARADDGAPAGLGLGLTFVRRIVEAHGGASTRRTVRLRTSGPGARASCACRARLAGATMTA